MGTAVTSRRRSSTGLVLLCALAAAFPVGTAAAVSGETLTGTVAIDQADAFAARRTARTPMLETGTERIALKGVEASLLSPGARVTVNGQRDGEGFAVRSSSSGYRSSAAFDERTDPVPATSKRVAVLLLNFRQGAGMPAPVETWTKPAVDELFFSGQRSVAAYYSEMSDAQLSITGDVFGYFTLSRSTYRCDYSAWGTAVRKAASAAGIDLLTYTNVVYVFPRQESCWWSGMSTVSGRNNWINGELTLYVASHELGHNFGLDHAAGLNCRSGGVRVAFSSTCSIDEYGDPFDVMGFTGQRHVHAWHRMQLGVLGAEEVQTVATNGTYRVGPAAVARGLPRVLRVPRRNGDYYYLEYRRPFGAFDDFPAAAAVANGVTIRLAPEMATVRSRLIDTTPETSSFTDAPLHLGRTFRDPVSGIYLTLLSLDPTGADVSVQLTSDRVAPTTPTDLSAAADEAGTVTLTWSTSTDDVIVTGYDVSRDGELVANVNRPAFVDRGLEPDRNYEYSVVARDRTNPSEPASVSVYVPVQTSDPPPTTDGDTTPPDLVTGMSAFVTGPRVGTVRWEAAHDDVGVDHYRVYRNGLGYAVTRELELTDVRLSEGAIYQFGVSAVDAAGNASEPVTLGYTVPDVSPPGQVFGLRAIVVDATSVRLKWLAVRDNVRVRSYEVRRNGEVIATIPAVPRSYTDFSLTADVAYVFTVAAVDAAGNVGPGSTVRATPHAIDRTAPTAPTDLVAQASTGRRISLTWSASTDDRGGSVVYRVFRGRKLVANVTNATFTDRVPRPAKYRYRVRAFDTAGNKSVVTPWITVIALV